MTFSKKYLQKVPATSSQISLRLVMMKIDLSSQFSSLHFPSVACPTAQVSVNHKC